MKNGNNPRTSLSLPEFDEANYISRRTLWVLLIGVFLISFSLLTLEISLTRILSVMLYYHYVFIVISLALLGLGTGGIYVYLFRRRVQHGHRRFSSLALFASLFALSIPLSTVAMTLIETGNIIFFGFFLFIPFFFAGVFLTEVFRTFPTLSPRIYGVDLLGAATGSLGVLLILNNLGDINTVLALGLIASIAALLYAISIARFSVRVMVLPVISFLLVSSLLGTNLVGTRLVDIPIGTAQYKDIHRAMNKPDNQGQIIDTRWSAFGRTDLVAFDSTPGVMGIYIDGTAGSSMYRFSGDINNLNPGVDSLSRFPGYLPLSLLEEEERNNALFIGPGGGRDILLALLAGVGEITAVEVNRELVDIVREYAWYNGGIYTDLENVSVYVDEGRNFLKRQKEKYDIIMLSLPVTNTSQNLQGYALTEDFLFTTDSIDDYLQHLTDDGRLIVVTHSQMEVVRLLSISLASLKQTGVSNETAMQQIYILGSHHNPVFVLKKTPFEPREMVSLHESIHQFGYDPTMSYVPTIRQGSCTVHMEENLFDECAMLFPPVMAISTGAVGLTDLENVLQEQDLDVSPVTDDSPFFFKFEEGIPQSVSQVLWASIIMLLLVILVPFMYLKHRTTERRANPKNRRILNKRLLRFVVLFSMLGIGFMLVEISAIQRFILFLGQPVLSLAILLFSLLVGAGLGSLYSGRFAPENISRVITVVSVIIVVVLLINSFSLSFILKQFMGLDLTIRLLITVTMLTPVGFVMGFLFPLGLRLLKEIGMTDYIPWMWGINGIGSVLGSALTIVVAINFGFTEALLLGAGCYFIVFLAFQGMRRKEVTVFKEGVVPARYPEAE
jgi:hypothetical protein